MNGAVRRLAVCAAGLVVLSLAAQANPPECKEDKPPAHDRAAVARLRKETSQPNPSDYQRVQQRLALYEQLDRQFPSRAAGLARLADAQTLAAPHITDQVLVILVEFAGTDSFVWTPGVTLWDPFGYCDAGEYDGVNAGNAIASSNLAVRRGVSTTTNFTYFGPLHNQIARPWSAEDRSGDMIWTPDFSTAFYHEIIFGNGWVFDYTRTNGSAVYEDYRGFSVRHYYEDQSRGNYTFSGTILGWVRVPHSVWWYGADPCPGRRSGAAVAHHGGIPGAGTARTLVTDAIEAAKSMYPGFNWARFDRDGDGLIDRLWIIHAGLGEEDSTILLDRTSYGEGGLWSHSASISPPYQIVPGVSAGPYIMMPENCGIGVLAHEYCHNLGADDLYAYDAGETSAGFWTLMADDWTGYPIGYLPPALDPWHVDGQGWLDPVVINTPVARTVTVWQASGSAGGPAACRAVKIVLPDQKVQQPVQPIGRDAWWGGMEDLANAMMTLTTPLNPIPAAGATLRCDLAYNIEEGWDFLWVQVSTNNGVSWITLSNAFATSQHDPSWIGGTYGMEGAAGFTGVSPGYPAFTNMSFNLNAFANQVIRLRFWYMTDWSTLWDGPFVDNISITAPGGLVLFSDNAESGDANWTYTAPWRRTDGYAYFTHNYYLQYRNTSANGGYDRALGDARWRFGPANTGLLVWYNNNRYTDNEVAYYLNDTPGFGPKGRMLVVDAHPEPYRDPYWVDFGYTNEGANVTSRSLMRDAPFSLWNSVAFTMQWSFVAASNQPFAGRPAVQVFDDSLGYYPGAEYVSRGPGYSPPRYIWLTKQWDASVVVPALAHYGINAPGYVGTNAFRFRATRTTGGQLSAYWYQYGLGYDGGSGNPGDYGAAYGVRVEILAQTPSNATVLVQGVPEPCLLWLACALLASRHRVHYLLRGASEGRDQK